jgi:hypothetical protein
MNTHVEKNKRNFELLCFIYCLTELNVFPHANKSPKSRLDASKDHSSTMKNTLCLYTELCIEHRRYDFKNYIIISLTLTSLFMHWRGERNIWSVFYAILRYGLF